MNCRCTWRVLALLLLIAGVISPLAAKKNESATGSPSAANGDPPPGNAMALSVPRARAVFRETLRRKYVGPMTYRVLMSTYTGEVSEVTNIQLRASGFDLVEPFTWMGKSNEGKYSVNFYTARSYLKAYSFKFGQTYYSLGFLPDPRRAPLGWAGLSGTVPVQFVWLNEADAQLFTDALNRLVYAAKRNEESADFQAFAVAARAWRENPVKPPLSPEAERQRILAENAIKERNINSAVEHYESGLEVQPMWPAGWFNLALIYAEQNNYADASDRMKHYLELVPDAPDAKDARTQMIIWEDKAKH